MAQASGSADFWLSDERQGDLSRRLWRAVAISLVVHVGVLAAVSWIRLPKHGERPLASIEIALATMPAPPVKADEPEKSEPKAAEVPAPAPPVRPAPIARMAPAPAPAPVKAPSNDVMGDVMKGISLPPNAPKFGDFS